MNNELISVIIPIYNGAKYLSQLLDSFSNQEYVNFELVMVDDGSVDDTYSILLGLKSKYEYNIKILHQVNKGVSAARNLGIDNAEGNYICFCDVDDFYHPHYLLKMYNAITENNLQIAVCKLEMSMKSKIEQYDFVQIESADINIVNTDAFLRDFLFLKVLPVHCCMMIDRCFLNKFEIRFSEGYRYGEDYDFSWRVLSKTNSLAFIDKPLYIYIWRADSVMARFDESRFDTIEIYSTLEKYIKTNRPDIAKEFCRYWKSRSLWSTVRQAANKMSYCEFIRFIEPYDIRNNMKKLLTYPDFKVSISSFIYYISPRAFYCLSRIINVKIH